MGEIYDRARRLYEASDRVGVPFQQRTVVIQQAWIEAAKRELRVAAQAAAAAAFGRPTAQQFSAD